LRRWGGATREGNLGSGKGARGGVRNLGKETRGDLLFLEGLQPKEQQKRTVEKSVEYFTDRKVLSHCTLISGFEGTRTGRLAVGSSSVDLINLKRHVNSFCPTCMSRKLNNSNNKHPTKKTPACSPKINASKILFDSSPHCAWRIAACNSRTHQIRYLIVQWPTAELFGPPAVAFLPPLSRRRDTSSQQPLDLRSEMPKGPQGVGVMRQRAVRIEPH